VLIWLMFWLVSLAPAGVRWLRRRQSQSWPWAESTIEGARLQIALRVAVKVSILTVTYSYSLNGERYGGVYAESFGSEPEAQAVLESLRSLRRRYGTNRPIPLRLRWTPTVTLPWPSRPGRREGSLPMMKESFSTASGK